ncbi:MAG: hypothetical protein VKM97_03920 [Cyanobacteriota bacterium]|nr:hypothetical protein [Cyanobacteriota bacterium]
MEARPVRASALAAPPYGDSDRVLIVGDLASPQPPALSPSADAPAPARARLSLPVAELVGLRFSVVHLRLVGYALIGLWMSELAALLTAPLLRAVGTRLHYISQALDLSPLLLVGLVLVAFQGGLQRNLLERLLLPLLFALLPLLSALHFVMIPASISNALTLSSKQLEVSSSQLRSIEGQLDRAGQVLASTANLEDLRRRLDAIPGVRLNATPDLSLEQARREVAESLRNERRRVRVQIGVSTAQARGQFTRRALQNTSLAILIGLVLAWLRTSAMQEMSISSAYLAWVQISDPESAKTSGLRDLIEFQKACLATSYLSILERLLRFASRPLDREKQEQERAREQEQEQALLQGLDGMPAALPPPAPWEPAAARLRSEEWRRRAGMFGGEVAAGSYGEELEPGQEEQGYPEPTLSPRQLRRQQRDRERVRQAMEQFARMVSDYEPGYGELSGGRRSRGPSQRQLRKAREALERFAQQFEENMGGEADPAVPASPLGFEIASAGRPAPGQADRPAGPAAAAAQPGTPAAEEPGFAERPAPGPPLPVQPDREAWLRSEELPPPPLAGPRLPRRPRNPLRRLINWFINHL